MKIVCVLFLCMSVWATTAPQARGQNLLPNGSFEQGTAHWKIFANTKLVDGLCGKHALRLHGAIQSETIHLARAEMYQVEFWYRGTRLRSTGLMDLPPTKIWTRQMYQVTGEYPIVIAFEGKGIIDCVTLTRVPVFDASVTQ